MEDEISVLLDGLVKIGRLEISSILRPVTLFGIKI
jgi:hypothetical protein